jgi:hypothetical protein
LIVVARPAASVADFGLKSNQLLDPNAVPENASGFEVRFEITNDCGVPAVLAGVRKTRPLGRTDGGAAAPAGTMLSTIAIVTGGCFPSAGVSVTEP